MQDIPTFKAQCSSCHAEIAYPELGDFAYGAFLWAGEQGTVFAHFTAINQPVYDFVEATLLDYKSGFESKAAGVRGDCARFVCARLADPVEGQRLVPERICPACHHSKWDFWGGARVGSIAVPEAEFSAFLARPASEQRAAVIECIGTQNLPC